MTEQPKDFITKAFEGKDITQSSLNLYRKNLIRLNDNQPPKSIKFLLDPQEILNKISKYKPNTQRSFIISISSLLSSLNKTKPTKQIKQLYQQYDQILTNLNQQLKDQTTKTTKEETNWMTQQEVKDILNQKKQILENLPKKLNETQYSKLLDLVILSLYTLQPPRRNLDYQDCFITRHHTNQPTNTNYLCLKDSKFYFNNYKTKGTYQTQEEPVSVALQEILTVYFKHHPLKKQLTKSNPIPLLVNYEGNPFKQNNDITRKLYKIFNKKVGVGMLRKIYLTDKFGPTLEELEEATKAMGTSVETAKNNYIKK